MTNAAISISVLGSSPASRVRIWNIHNSKLLLMILSTHQECTWQKKIILKLGLALGVHSGIIEVPTPSLISYLLVSGVTANDPGSRTLENQVITAQEKCSLMWRRGKPDLHACGQVLDGDYLTRWSPLWTLPTLMVCKEPYIASKQQGKT
jgi:hypothetical protein